MQSFGNVYNSFNALAASTGSLNSGASQTVANTSQETRRQIANNLEQMVDLYRDTLRLSVDDEDQSVWKATKEIFRPILVARDALGRAALTDREKIKESAEQDKRSREAEYEKRTKGLTFGEIATRKAAGEYRDLGIE